MTWPTRTKEKGPFVLSDFSPWTTRFDPRDFLSIRPRGGGVVEVPITVVADQDWRSQASCASADPDLWFSVGAIEHKQAKAICRGCPVRRECLVYAMESPVDQGIWGGYTERERRKVKRLADQRGWRAALSV